MIGNEFADAIAKHAVLHNYGHDEAFPPPWPSPDGNPFAHIYWLAEESNETTHTTTKISLAPLQNIKDKLKAHMSKHHRLGDANTNSGKEKKRKDKRKDYANKVSPVCVN